VSEGESYENYSKVYSPINKVKTESEKLAMKLVTFEMVDIYKVKIPFKLTKKEKACQHTEDIGHQQRSLRQSNCGGIGWTTRESNSLNQKV
jgi:hypothetical protein